MSTSTTVSFGAMKAALTKYTGTSISKVIFTSQPGLVRSLYYNLFLNYQALPFPTSPEGEIIHLNADEHRLRSLLFVFIEYVNQIHLMYTGLEAEHGNAVIDAVNLSDKFRELTVELSTQERKSVDKDSKIADLKQGVLGGEAQIEALKIQHVNDMLDNENNGQLLGFSEEAGDRLREQFQESQSVVRRLEEELAQLKVELSQRDIQLVGLQSALDNAKIDLCAKRNASEDINMTPQKYPNQGRTGSNNPASSSDSAGRVLFDSDDSD